MLANDTIKEMFAPLASVYLFRTIGISAYNVLLYVPFFDKHSLTYYSHVNGINKFVEYPYGELALGQVIGLEYTGNQNFNANATFFITDGISAWALWGVIICSLVLSILFLLTDTVSYKHNVVFTSMLFCGVTSNLMNVSLFTTLISGGWIILILFLSLFKSSNY